MVPPILIPLAERLGRRALRRRGVDTRWVETPQGTVHVYDAPGGGSLPTTVLLHGIGSAATPFGPVLARLRPNMKRVVAPDYPGHGFSSDSRTPLDPTALFDSVRLTLERLVPEPSIVVGNSLGGALALQYAVAHPERVRGLVLVSPAGAHSTDAEWRALRRVFELANTGEAREFLRRVYHRPPWFIPLVAFELPATIGQRPAVRELLAAATNEHLPTPEELAALPMPILLVWGQSERLLPPSHLAYFEKHLPRHARVERPLGFGHCPHVDAPAALSARITAFARTLDGG